EPARTSLPIGPALLLRAGGLEPVEPGEQRQGLLGRGAAVERRGQQPPRGLGIAARERGGAVVDELLSLALTLGDRAARALDVGAGAGVAAVEEEHPGPDIDRQLVLTREIVIETAEQELLDAGVTIAIAGIGLGGVEAKRVAHAIRRLSDKSRGRATCNVPRAHVRREQCRLRRADVRGST